MDLEKYFKANPIPGVDEIIEQGHKVTEDGVFLDFRFKLTQQAVETIKLWI